MNPRVALLVIGDGRDRLQEATRASFSERARDVTIVGEVEVDDRLHRLGFCGAIQQGWSRLRAVREALRFDYVFHLEEDWEFVRDVSIRRMAEVLDSDRSLCQIALRRGIENAQERAAGGVIEQWPDEYDDRFVVGDTPARSVRYLRHRLFWTTNPSLYRADLLDSYSWPDAPRCEEAFGETMRAEGLRFAYLGDRSDEPLVEHTGRGDRRGRGY